jgi:hypothetical protein
MPGYQPARAGARRETIQEFMDRRRREVASFGREAEAAAYGAVKRAIRAGQDYRLMTPGEVMAYGSHLLRRPQAKAPAQAPRAPVRAKSRGLDDSAAAKAVGGTLAYAAGLAPGAARGVGHMVEGTVDGAIFAQRLMSPADALFSPPGQSAVEQVYDLGRSATDYVVRGVQDPSMVREDLASGFHDFRVKHDPTATPVADTLGGEMKRAFALGMNGGELALDVGSLVVGGGAIRGAAGLGRAAKAATATERAYLAVNPRIAAQLELPYPKRGMSHHIVNRAAELPKWLGGGRYPEWFIESEFNKIRHDGISNRDFYRNHVGAGGDKHFNGGPVRRKFGGGGWKARDLGWDTYGPLDRLNYGTSPATKAVLGPLLVGGTTVDSVREREAP